ncbi:hypothetical protein [Calothrix sp. CCY 0018]|uniref:hypothetical protein n=1 Tax=Calothrix sp. CCY 0018 TaxID=3103864 RepID=UPI0039C6C8F9
MIADIDKLLAHKGKRLWGVISSQEEPREVLQRVRDFLANESEGSANSSSQAQIPPLVAKFMEEGHNSEDLQQPQSTDNLLSELIQPLKLELKTLYEERANLVSEIRDLEKKRLHDYSLAQQLASQEKIISEFMQVLQSRLQDNIVVGNSVSSFDGSADTTIRKALPASSDRVDSGRVENLTKLTNDLDQRLVALDGTVNVVFEGLQRNIHAYHDSLSQALSRMHYKGVQGEQLLESFIKNVANLSPAQINSAEFIKQATDDITVETIDAQSVESTQINNQTNSQLKQDFQPVESDKIKNVEYNQDTNDNLVTPDETIDNIEFSQAQQSSDDSSSTFDLEKIISQLEEDSVSEDLSEASNQLLEPDNSVSEELSEASNQLLEPDNHLEVEFPEKREQEREEKQETEKKELVEEDAFDSPEKMQAVLTELKKSTSQEELPADIFSDNEDEVDELYASLFDSDRTTTSNPQPPQQVITQAIDVENLATSADTSTEIDSQLLQTPIEEEKEVVSSEVVFEYVRESSTEERSPITDPWNGDNKDSAADSESTIESTQNPPQLNQAAAKTYKRKTQAASEDTVTTLTELLFEEEAATEVASEEIVTPVEAPSEQETATPEVQQEVAAPAEQEATTPEAVIQPTSDQPQLKEISLRATSLRQPDKNEEAITEATTETSTLDSLPQTEKTIAPDEENSQDNSSYVTSTEIPSINSSHTVWYLGLDIGTTGISAALLNRSTTEIHPIYWAQENQSQTNSQNRNFRLPAEVYLPKTSISQDKGDCAEQNIYSAYLKPYLPISLPYKSISETASSEVRQKWEPILQLNEFSAVPLVWIIRSLSKLLLTLKSDSNSTTLGLTATAIRIEKEQFSNIINNIAGIICTCPSEWSEQYRFNIRESLLISQLVEHPQQVFFVEEAIASLLGELEGANGEIVKLVQNENYAPVITSDRHLTGNTLVINIGASATEMTLVDIPEDLLDLSHNEFMLHGFTCGGKAMEQDIITQLLLPEKWRKSRNSQSEEPNIDNNPLHWKPNIPGLDKVRFSSLELEQLELPRAGEPDISQRIRLQQRLESSPLGKALLDAAIALKLILQHQESFLIELADQRWELQRRDLESQVFVPFVRRINRELNKLLVARGIPTEAINQIILSGGVSSINAISRWLQQKLPSAKIIQEKYLGENGTPATSRVAQGLCLLPLHPLVLEIPRQQYTDYFLFTELLRLIPEKATTFGEVIGLFESRGINTRSCQQRLLAFLEGEIPPGLVPSSQDMQWLNKSSVQNSNYKSISASPLFDKQGSLSYRPNLRQLQHLRNYLDAIKASAHQSLEEPYTVNFAVGVRE